MAEEESRPDPDKILRRIQAEEQRSSGRGLLKVFLGYAPGVGKTYTMLESARGLVGEGADVVVGCVETHGRAETETLLQGLEVLPRQSLHYHGTVLHEFDLDAALRRKPSIVLVDELAHTNALGCRHKKRWQDILELLDSGIEVHTTVNIQHIASLNDVIYQITGIRVRETVPDSLLEAATTVELVDLPPGELLERLRQGKVYVPNQAQRALEHFFRPGNLLALRELALRRAAERIDRDVQAYRQEHEIRQTWPAGERLLACVSPSPSSEQVIRATARMAAGLRAPWVAAWVEAPDAHPMKREDRYRLQAHLRLAESLGAEVTRLAGAKVSEALIQHAQEQNITRILVGKPTHSRWRDIVKGSTVNQLLRSSGHIEVHFVGSEPVGVLPAPDATLPKRRSYRKGVAIAALLVAIAALFSYLLKPYLALADIVMVFFMAITVSAFRFGKRSAITAAALSVASYDFFFIDPYYTFAIDETRHFLTFLMMFAVGLAVSSLASRLRRQNRDGRRREERTAALYHLTRDLAACSETAEVARVVQEHASAVFGGKAVLFTLDATGVPVAAYPREAQDNKDQEGMAVVKWAAQYGREAGEGTDTLPGARFTCYPLTAGARSVGVLALWQASRIMVEAENRKFLDAFLRQAAISLERARLVRETEEATVRARTEETRSSLLSVVSHDLRTPLAAITGAGSLLRERLESLGAAQRSELLETVCSEAERMERLVSNILDMVRVESGALQPKKDWVPVEELVGSALGRLERRLGGCEVATNLPEELPMLHGDPVLMEQVLYNLIDNSIRHGKSDQAIEIAAFEAEGMLALEVRDRGPGIPQGLEERIFEKFFRCPGSQRDGAGLGLAICRGIVQAHGGSLTARNRAEGGACFRISLPLGPKPPESLPLDAAVDDLTRGEDE